MKLRPHHLLCTQGYSGKGYSDHFVDHMTAVTQYLRNDAYATIALVFSTDDICGHCPKMLGTGRCRDDYKVLRYDRKMIEYFGLEEKAYDYKALTAEINAKMTPEMMDDICGDCCWYPICACNRE